MKKINIIDDLDSKTVVDDELLLDHNQNSSEQSESSSQDHSQGKNGVNLTGKDKSMKSFSKLFLTLTIVAVLAGVGTGFGSFKLFAKSGSDNMLNGKDISQLPEASSVKEGDVFGSTNDTFKDTAMGYLEDGGLDGEGSHKLLRPGGDSQTVYLTSSVTDLDELVGMEVKIWGETFKGQKAGWLMDVGRVEVLKVDGESPAEE